MLVIQAAKGGHDSQLRVFDVGALIPNRSSVKSVVHFGTSPHPQKGVCGVGGRPHLRLLTCHCSGERPMKQILAPAAIAVALALAAPAPSWAESVDAPAVIVENPQLLSGLDRVAIGSFTVDVVDRMEADTRIAGIELVAGLPSNIVVTLKGVDEASYPALVEVMYDRFVGDLQAQGVSVLSRDDLAVSPDFAVLDSPPPRDEYSPAGTGRYITAHGLPIYLVDETTLFPKMQFQGFGHKAERDPYISWTTSLGAGFAALGYQHQRDLARKLGVPVLNVRITMLGGQAHIDKTFWRSGASARTDAAMSFAPLYNRVLVVRADGPMARVALGQPIVTGKLGELVNVTSGAGRAAEAGLNTAIAASRVMGAFVPGGGLIGSMNYQKHVAYEVRSDQQTFEIAVGQGFGEVSATLVHALVPKPIAPAQVAPAQVARADPVPAPAVDAAASATPAPQP